MKSRLRIENIERNNVPKLPGSRSSQRNGRNNVLLDFTHWVSDGKKENSTSNESAADTRKNNPAEKGPGCVHSRGRARLALRPGRGKRSSWPDETRLLRYSLARVVQCGHGSCFCGRGHRHVDAARMEDQPERERPCVPWHRFFRPYRHAAVRAGCGNEQHLCNDVQDLYLDRHLFIVKVE